MFRSIKTALPAPLGLALALLLTANAHALEAGWRHLSIASPPPHPATTVALYYPTQATAQAVHMGPFTPRVAIGAAPADTVKGLIMLSHGTGGTELGHSSLAEALAKSGYLVAALRHPGDNWQDRSMMQGAPSSYFAERPRQVSRVIDALLQDPLWKDRIARDAQGPRIGALGHSAGGYTVLALVGGQPLVRRIVEHCKAHASSDVVFCATRRQAGAPDAVAPPNQPPTQQPMDPRVDEAIDAKDPRVRAVVAMAPLGLVFTAASLASIRAPVLIYEAQQDRWLQPRFHTAWLAQHMPQAQLQRVPNAWHFAFMDKPASAIVTDDGDIAADAAGFDRAVLLARMALELPAFFDQALR